jgi:hypothetical protein
MDSVQNVSASDGPVPSPMISRRPSVLTATAIMAAMPTIRPPCRTLRYVASSQRQGQSPASGRFRNSPTRSSMSLQSFDTVLFEIPLSPMACTSSSTRRVETPPIQASWITATSAFPDVRRGSRKPGK